MSAEPRMDPRADPRVGSYVTAWVDGLPWPCIVSSNGGPVVELRRLGRLADVPLLFDRETKRFVRWGFVADQPM